MSTRAVNRVEEKKRGRVESVTLDITTGLKIMAAQTGKGNVKTTKASEEAEHSDETGNATAIASMNANTDLLREMTEMIKKENDKTIREIKREVNDVKQELKRDIDCVKQSMEDLKGEFTVLMDSKLAEFSKGVAEKLHEVDAGMAEQRETMEGALKRTEELEDWSDAVNGVLKGILEERQGMINKLDDLESRSRRCNLRFYSFPEDCELKSESVAQFISEWVD